MRCEVELLKVHAKTHQQQYESIDRQIAHKIEEEFPPNQDNVTLYIGKWQSLCKTEEELSEDIWKEKKERCREQELDANPTRNREIMLDSIVTKQDQSNAKVGTGHRQYLDRPDGTNRFVQTFHQTYRPDTRCNYSRTRPSYNNNSKSFSNA